MGFISYPTTSGLILHLRNKFDLKTAVETGTFQGDATYWLAERFGDVITIDISEEFQTKAKEKCSVFNTIEYLVGDSRVAIWSVISKLTLPSLFWLDAHNTLQMYGPGQDDCPILEELDAIFTSPFKHFLIIDDANSFLPLEQRLHLPPEPLADHWPVIDAIKEKAELAGYVCLAKFDDDVMAIVPKEYIDDVIDFFGETL